MSDLHPNVALLRDMDYDEHERWWAGQVPSTTCALCLEFKEWLGWASGEPTSLQSFLWYLFDEHTNAAAEE